MKITAAFLLVTVSCFFVPAISNSIKCRKGCQQNPKWQSSCLEVSLINNLLPTINVLAEFICAYDKFKNAEDKSKLSTAIQNIETVTGCSLSNLLGSETTLDDLLMDVNGALQNLLKTVLHLLKGLKLESITTSMCGSLKPTLSKVLETLDYTPDGPEQNELTQTTGGEKRPTRDLLSNLLGGVTSIVPGLTGNANGCQGQQGGNGGILNVGGLVKDLPLVRQLLGGQNGGLLSILGLLQNVPVVGGIVGGQNGGLLDIPGLLQNVQVLGELVGGGKGGLQTGGRGGGLLNGIPLVGDLLSNIPLFGKLVQNLPVIGNGGLSGGLNAYGGFGANVGSPSSIRGL